MKYIYIKLNNNLIDALYQLITARIISSFQEGTLVIDPINQYKDSIFKNYNFKKINCRNIYDENKMGLYNSYTIKCYKNDLEIIGEFKNVEFFWFSINDFKETLHLNGFENEFNEWLNDVNKKKILKNNNLLLNLFSNKYVNSIEHRGGWKDVIENLYNNYLLTTNDSDYYFIDILDNYYDNNIFLKKKWFGIIHSTVFVPDFLNICNIDDIMNGIFLKNNINTCLGIITFTDYVRKVILNYNKDIHILYIKHPINTIDIKLYSHDNFKNNKNKHLVLLGKQLRKLSSIYIIKSTYNKVWLPGTKKFIDSNILNLKNECLYLNKNNIDYDFVDIKYFDSYIDYDNFLLNNIIIIDLWDANANNSILECLIRNIPFFINKIEPVIEYLGNEYPMYFNTLTELENMYNNNLEILYKKTNLYLKNINKDDLTFQFFNKTIKKFFFNSINKLEILYSNIKEHDNWTYIEKYLAIKFNTISFIKKMIFIPFVDKFILDNSNIITIFDCNLEWFGILHNPDLSTIYPNENIFLKKKFIHLLKSCKGLFVMSDQLKNIIIEKFKPDFFIHVIIHPFPYLDLFLWSFDSFQNNKNKKIIQIGNWLRKTYTIFKINVPYYKAITPFNDRTEKELKFWTNHDNIIISSEEYENVIKYNFLDNKEYNEIFKNNIVFLDLYDSTANNVILECIKSNCPIIINENINIKKYLGNHYPLYYTNYEQINDLLNPDNINKAHEYLKNMNKEIFDIDYFSNNIINILKNNNLII